MNTRAVLRDVDDSRRNKMHVIEGPDQTPVRRPVRTFNHREQEVVPGFMTPEARASTLVVNQEHVAIAQLQHQIDKLEVEIDKEEVMKGELTDFIYVVLDSIAPLQASASGVDSAGTTARRSQLRAALAECMSSPAASATSAKVASAIRQPNTVFGAMVSNFLKRAQHEKHSRHVSFAPVLLHTCLLISNTSPAAYNKLQSILPSLPVARTLRSYNSTGDFGQRQNSTMFRRFADAIAATGATGMSLHGTLSFDELKCADVRRIFLYHPRALLHSILPLFSRTYTTLFTVCVCRDEMSPVIFALQGLTFNKRTGACVGFTESNLSAVSLIQQANEVPDTAKPGSSVLDPKLLMGAYNPAHATERATHVEGLLFRSHDSLVSLPVTVVPVNPQDKFSVPTKLRTFVHAEALMYAYAGVVCHAKVADQGGTNTVSNTVSIFPQLLGIVHLTGTPHAISLARFFANCSRWSRGQHHQ